MEPVSTILRDDASTEEALSLVGRAERIFRHGQAEDAAPVEVRVYPDGYARRSPHQRPFPCCGRRDCARLFPYGCGQRSVIC